MVMKTWLEKTVFEEDNEPNLLLLQTKSKLMLAAEDFAIRLEDKFETELAPIEAGLYKPGRAKPERSKLNTNGSYINQKLDTSNPLSAESITNNKNSFLLDKPNLPARGMLVIEALVCREINQITPYCKEVRIDTVIDRLFTQRIDKDELRTLCHELLIQVADFIGDDVWNMYCISMHNTDLTIEKTQDFRIYDWHLQRHLKRNENQDG